MTLLKTAIRTLLIVGAVQAAAFAYPRGGFAHGGGGFAHGGGSFAHGGGGFARGGGGFARGGGGGFRGAPSAGHASFSRGAAAYHSGGHYYNRSCGSSYNRFCTPYYNRSCGRSWYNYPCYSSWGFGGAFAPTFYGGVVDYTGGYVGYSEPPPAIVERNEPPPEITQWADEDLRHMALDKFSITRDLDPSGNRIALELIRKEFDDDTGALIKAKFKVRWVEWKISHQKDGREVREEKSKSTTVKLKFDDLGRFTEYCD